jgi:HEAT repeat protein
MSPDFGIHDRPIHELIEELKETDWSLRLRAALALSSMVSTDRSVLPALIRALQDRTSVNARKMAALVLGFIGPQGGTAAFALIAALQDENPGVRRRAANALDRMSQDASRAAPDLLQVLWDRRENVAAGAAFASDEISPEVVREAKVACLCRGRRSLS